MIARLEPDERIPSELREVYARLAGNVIETCGALDELVFLFTSEEIVSVLNATAGAFFVRHQRLLLNHIILSLSRMMDKQRSGSLRRPQENLTLDRLLELPDAKYKQLRTDLESKWTEIKRGAEPLRTYRHKFLAHASLVHHLSPSTKLGDDISIASIKKLLEQISDFLNTFDCFFTGVETTSYSPPARYGDADDLIAYLKLAIETENKAKNEVLKAADEASRAVGPPS
jgi:HEPN superfamily AbiU2-like protein